MSQGIILLLTAFAAIGSGLIAGFFFSFTVVEMPALDRVSPGQRIAAMQSINIVVLNPLFFIAFFGTAAVCVALGASSLFSWQRPGSPFLLAGSALYLLGVIVCHHVVQRAAQQHAESGEGASL